MRTHTWRLIPIYRWHVKVWDRDVSRAKNRSSGFRFRHSRRSSRGAGVGYLQYIRVCYSQGWRLVLCLQGNWWGGAHSDALGLSLYTCSHWHICIRLWRSSTVRNSNCFSRELLEFANSTLHYCFLYYLSNWGHLYIYVPSILWVPYISRFRVMKFQVFYQSIPSYVLEFKANILLHTELCANRFSLNYPIHKLLEGCHYSEKKNMFFYQIRDKLLFICDTFYIWALERSL